MLTLSLCALCPDSIVSSWRRDETSLDLITSSQTLTFFSLLSVSESVCCSTWTTSCLDQRRKIFQLFFVFILEIFFFLHFLLCRVGYVEWDLRETKSRDKMKETKRWEAFEAVQSWALCRDFISIKPSSTWLTQSKDIYTFDSKEIYAFSLKGFGVSHEERSSCGMC